MITASIVLYNTPKIQVETVLKSVFDSKCIEKLYVIDNSPNDWWRCIEKSSPIIRYVHNENTGYGASHNLAMRKAAEEGSTYHIVLNPDLKFDSNVVQTLYEFMEAHKEVGHVMPKIVNQEGEVQYLCKLVPSPSDLIFKRFLPKSFSKNSAYKFQLKFADYDKEMDVPYLSGCFMFFRMEAVQKVKGFDERFFMYPEDIDITRRIHKFYRTVYYPKVFVYHLHAAESYHSKRMLKIHIQNMIKYFNKWGWLFDSERKRFNIETLEKLDYKNLKKGGRK